MIKTKIYNLDNSYDPVQDIDESLKESKQHLNLSVPSDDAYSGLKIVQLLDDLNIESKTVILDVGCGLGNVGYSLRQDGFTGSIVGVEINPLTAEKVALRGLYDEVIVGSCHDTMILKRSSEYGSVIVTMLYEVIEHLPLDIVPDVISDIALGSDISFICSPSTIYAQDSQDNPYDVHVRCYDPIEQVINWCAVDVWNCTPGGRLTTVHSKYYRDGMNIMLQATPLKFRGSFSRKDVFDRLKGSSVIPQKDYKRVLGKLSKILKGRLND
jgi:SAM-dependent methyltransferase